MAVSLGEAKQRTARLKEFIAEMMAEGVDYGIIPKTDKRCLFKPGAEKLCNVFGLSKQVEILHRIEDFENAVFHYEVKATLIGKATGAVEAEGVGACNSRENKYRNQDAFNIANTVLKMAKKRAFIDAALTATGSSDLFTQDVDDTDERGKGASKRPLAKKTEESDEAATKRQISYIFAILSERKIPVETARADMERLYGVNESKKLSKEQAGDFISYLKDYKAG
jgi:stalled ribosome alternative rescue factor ArfA